MNAMTALLLWCVIQVTVLGIAAGLVYGVARRVGPAMGAFVAFFSLLIMIAVTIVSVGPWPSWFQWVDAAHESATTALGNVGIAESAADESHQNSTGPSPAFNAPSDSSWILFAKSFRDELQRVRWDSDSSGWTWNWPKVIAVVVLFSVFAGTLRLMTGLIAVRRFRRHSEPLHDAELHELVDIMAAEMRCTRPIELRETREVTGAATFGWRRPVILLPREWRHWSGDQRRAVLAHEMAHIVNHDYLTWLFAQVGLALHFYHPLAHYLCRCLRLDQELVADSMAARMVGGQQPYLQSLAHIALQQADVSLSWPARTFLPTRRTFLRRIEMLRNSKSTLARLPMAPRFIVAGLLVAAGLAVLGIRDPGDMLSGVAGAQEQPKPKPIVQSPPGSEKSEFKLAYIPRDAMFILALRPSATLKRPVFQPLLNALEKAGNIEESLGIRPEMVESLQLFVLPPADEPGPEPVATIIRTVDAASAKELAVRLAPRAKKETYAEQEYYRQEPTGMYFKPDDKTIVYAQDEGVIRRSIVAGSNGAAGAKWASVWNTVAGKDAAVLVNTSMFRGIIAKQGNVPPPVAAYAPLWEQTDIAVASLEIADEIQLKVSAKSTDAAGARRVRDTLAAAVTTARNLLSPARDAIARQNNAEGPIMLGAIDIADGILENVKIDPVKDSDTQVVATATATADDTVKVVKILVPAVGAARAAARRTVDSNNLKQIALAFHNYHDTYGHFPAAVVYGPNNVPRSWRVELLPFLEQAPLYNQYRQDEPWDSENNKKILAQIPPVYRSPSDAPDSLNTSYFALPGDGTVFDKKEGAKLQEILDGTSNTLLVVEAKRNIPWSKPEDIPYDDSKEVPSVGGWYPGGFLTAFCDGSVRFIPQTVDKGTLRLLILKADGQPVNLNQ